MNERDVHDILSGRRRGLGAGAVRAVTSVAALPYAAVVRARRWAYEKNLLSRTRAGVPVICVGNLTTGGTGKTPMVAWVVERLTAAGHRPAILTRGYKSVDGLSDEARLLEQLTSAAVYVQADRVASAKAAKAAGADVLVMDDGFQHLRLARDLDIVLVDATHPLGYGRCLPRGLLREPPAALARAGAIVITRSDGVGPEDMQSLRGLLLRYAPQVPVFEARHAAAEAIDPDGKGHPPGTLAGKKLFAFCGVGNPESFFDTLTALGADVVGSQALDDHVAYDAALETSLAHAAASAGAQAMVTTQKDYVKLSPAWRTGHAWQLVVRMEIPHGQEALITLVESAACGSAPV